MERLLLLFLAALPVFIILYYVYSKDKNKESLLLLIKLFLLGVISACLVVFISLCLKWVPFMNYNDESSFISIMLYSFLGVALVEEFCKWIMVYAFGYYSDAFDEIYDIIVYSVFVSLGFAFFENILYVMKNASFSTAIMRGLLAIPAHACDAVFMGYYLSIAKVYSKLGNKKEEVKNTILSVLIPALLHGIYDFCLFSGYKIFLIVFLVFVVLMYNISLSRLSEVASISNKSRFCPKCGAYLKGNYCDKCGWGKDNLS